MRRCHRGAEEAGVAERGQRAHAMRDGVAGERDLGIALVGEHAAARIADAVERAARDVGRGDEQQGALGAGSARIDTAAAGRRVGHAELGDLGAEQGEDGVRVVAGVLVDREDLERQPETTQVLGRAPDRDPDGFFVVAKR